MPLSDTLLQTFPMAWVALGHDGVIVDLNAEFASLVREERKGLIGAQVVNLWQPLCQSEFLGFFADLVEGLGSEVAVHVTLNRKGRPVDLCLSGQAAVAEDGLISVTLVAEPLVTLGVRTATTPLIAAGRLRDSAEMVLRRGNTLKRSWICTANDAAEKLQGQSEEALVRGTVETVLNIDFSMSSWLDAEAAFQAGRPFKATLVDKLSDAQFQLVEWQLAPCDPKDPQLRFWLDQRRVRSRAVKDDWQQPGEGSSFETARVGGDTGIWSWNLLNNKINFSTRLLNALGYCLDDIEDEVAFNASMFHPDDLGLVDRVVKFAIQELQPYRIIVRMKGADGRYRSILVRGQPVCDEEGVPFQLVGTETEVTEQLELERKLLRAERIARVGNFSRRLGDDAMYWSPEMRRIYGLDSQYGEVTMLRAREHYHPDDLHFVTGGEARILKKWRRNPNMVDRQRVRITRPDGSIRHLELLTRVDVDAEGNPAELVGTAQDRTEIVESEQRMLMAQKMEVVGQLAGGAAHDFNNLLAVIMGNLELLADENDPGERDEYIESALQATRRGGELTRNLLSFARQAVLKPSRLNLIAVTTNLQKILRRVLPESIGLDVELAPDLWFVNADRGSFDNAVLNLAINARDAMPIGGHITIKAKNKVLAETDTEEQQDNLEPGPYVVFSLTDTGTGISPEVVQDVFTPYFTTKPADKGSGLGLSMVHGFARQSGGGLRLYSEVGVGTTIKLFFPASEFKS